MRIDRLTFCLFDAFGPGDRLQQLSGRSPRVRSGEYGRDGRDAVSPSLNDLRHAGRVDAPDRQNWQGAHLPRLLQDSRREGRAIGGLGWRIVDGAENQEVSPALDSLSHVRKAVTGNTKQHLMPDKGSRVFRREAFPGEMDAIGAQGHCHIHPVVDEQHRAGLATQREQPLSQPINLDRVEPFFSKLDRSNTRL